MSQGSMPGPAEQALRPVIDHAVACVPAVLVPQPDGEDAQLQQRLTELALRRAWGQVSQRDFAVHLATALGRAPPPRPTLRQRWDRLRATRKEPRVVLTVQPEPGDNDEALQSILDELALQRAWGQISQRDFAAQRALVFELLRHPHASASSRMAATSLASRENSVLERVEDRIPQLSLEAHLAELGRQRAFGQISQRDFEDRRAVLLGPRGVASLASRPADTAALPAGAVIPAPLPRPEDRGPQPSLEAHFAELGRQRAFGQISQQDFEDRRAFLLGPPPLPLTEDWARWGAARDGARVVLTRPQVCALVLLTVLVPILLWQRPHFTLIGFIGVATALYFALGVHRIWLLIRGESGVDRAAADSQVAAGDDLPTYTVLVPLHREARMLPVLVERLKLIDYPASRLEILLLIEMDDVETQRAARSCPLPSHIRSMIMPPGQPRTKPRALNVGLHEAQGEYLVIYDAEDRPEHDQLRKAVAAFRSVPANIVCLQARLNFYNRHQSLLTRLFAVDYATWYDQLLPGLTHWGPAYSPVFAPLGGTSNHFRVDTLRQIGGWDPFNVTEDCDVGVRLARARLLVAMLDSVTWEEAVPRVKPWIRQRSRWVKGYLQTYLVHMRHPLLLWKQLGLRGLIDFQMLVGGSSLVLLLNPLMWTLTALYLAEKGTHFGTVVESLFPPVLYYPALVSLVAVNFILFYCNAYVCVRHNYIDLTRYTVFTPLYWVLMSVGAWLGLLSLIRNPFYWAKTEHGTGLSETDGPAALAVGHFQAGHSATVQPRQRNN